MKENNPHLKSLALEIPAERNSGSTSSSHPRRRHSPHTLHPAGPFRGFKCAEAAVTAAAATSSGRRPTDKNGDFKRLRSARACRLMDNISRRFLRETGWHSRRRSVGCDPLPVAGTASCVFGRRQIFVLFCISLSYIDRSLRHTAVVFIRMIAVFMANETRILAEKGGGRGWGGTYDLVRRSYEVIDLAFLRSRGRTYRLFAGPKVAITEREAP